MLYIYKAILAMCDKFSRIIESHPLERGRGIYIYICIVGGKLAVELGITAEIVLPCTYP